MGYVKRFLPYQHFLCNNLHPRKLRYPVEHLGNYFKGTKNGLHIINFLELQHIFFGK